MILLRQSLPAGLRMCAFHSLSKRGECRPIAPDCFARGNGRPSVPIAGANYPQMNFTQMHEHLRLELLRRIQRGRSASLYWPARPGLARHILQFSAQPAPALAGSDGSNPCRPTPGYCRPSARLQQAGALPPDEERSTVPIVSHAVALYEPYIRPSVVQSMLHLPAGVLQTIRARVSNPHRTWQRFVAVRIPVADALPWNR